MAAQIIANSIYATALITLCAIGFASIYRTSGFLNFAYGFTIAAGAYAAYVFTTSTGLPLVLAIVAGGAAACAVGILLELSLFRPIRQRSSSPLTPLLASLGAYVVLQNVLSLAFGDHTRVLRHGGQSLVYSIAQARVTDSQMATVLVSVIFFIGWQLFLCRTAVGKRVRAVADDATLADSCGIDSDRIRLVVMGLASAGAGLAGALIALDVGLSPGMGLPYLMLTVVVVVIGGAGRSGGIVAVAALLSIAQNLAVWHVGAHWRDGIAFGVLLLFLLVRAHRTTGPHGQRMLSRT